MSGSDVAAPAPSRRRTGWPAHWPLTALFVGFPLWWVLGLRSILPVLVALPMAVQLARRGHLRIPSELRVWFLFLLWVLLGAAVLYADAPGAAPGGGLGRILVFGYSAARYVAATVVYLWIVNTPRRELSDARVHGVLGYMFVVTTVGGLLGILVPEWDFPSLLETGLPPSLANNAFVAQLVHPAVADVQDVLGRPEARPVAPFAFSNAWGANLALFLPFFLAAWLHDGRRWQKVLAPVILLVAAAPVVDSLNRGLWGTLVAGAVLFLVLQLRRGSAVRVAASTLALVVGFVALAASPLATTIQERLDNPHSNERRGQLLVETVRSASEGSPVVGFGATRDVQGSFSSLAGGATADCQACGVPPLGTQGQLWNVIFTQGLVGAVLLLAFLVMSARRSWRTRTLNETLAAFAILFVAVQMVVYDLQGSPWFTAMIALALVAREQIGTTPPPAPAEGRWSSGTELAHAVRRTVPAGVALVVLGGVLGGLLFLGERSYSARAAVLVRPAPLYLDPVVGEATTVPLPDTTIDTEAALVLDEESLRAATGGDAAALHELRQRIRITAPAGTRVLEITVTADDPRQAEMEAEAVATTYLATRRASLAARRAQVLQVLDRRLAEIEATGVYVEEGIGEETATGASRTALVREALQRAIATNRVADTQPGELVRVVPAKLDRRQLEVGITSGVALGLAVGALLVGRTLRRRPQGGWASDLRRSRPSAALTR